MSASAEPEAVARLVDLAVRFVGAGKPVQAVNGVSLSLAPGEVLCIIGESGSGKSVTLRALLRLLPERRARISGRIEIGGRDVLALPPRALRDLRGGLAAMIFQEPMTALDPVYTIGAQIGETIRRHLGGSAASAQARALELLELVGVPSAARRLGAYPHELSGGLRQRAMIALALSCGPKLLLADEPTTALDATVQIQVLLLLRRLRAELGMAVIFVTHDLGVAAEIADRVAVMYAGRIVEEGTVADVLARPLHPYTMGLLASSVEHATPGEEIAAIPGAPPDLRDLPQGCAFAPRCGFAAPACQPGAPARMASGAGPNGALPACAGTRRPRSARGGARSTRFARRNLPMTDALPKVAFIGTGGTISSLGAGPLDILDYGASQNMLHAEAIVARVPELALVADVTPVRFRNVPSHRIFFPEWRELVLLCDRLVAETPDLAGIVIGHGTASLEETAWFLSLTLKIDVPVVLVGSQRPASALSTDASMNLLNAVRVAANPSARGMGVLALLNDEIPCRARGHENLDLPVADLSHARFRCARPRRRRCRRVLPQAGACGGAAYRVRRTQARLAATGGYRLRLHGQRRRRRTRLPRCRRRRHRIGRICARFSRLRGGASAARGDRARRHCRAVDAGRIGADLRRQARAGSRLPRRGQSQSAESTAVAGAGADGEP